MKKEMFDGFTYVEGGVCAAKGFVANGLNCGLNPNKEKNDLGIVYSEKTCASAAVFTTNKVKAAPVWVSMKHLELSNGNTHAVIANSKNANACNEDGEAVAEKVCEIVAKKFDIDASEVLVASTGVIGQKMPVEPFEEYMDELVNGMSSKGHTDAATAIMTTDTVKKEVAVKFMIDGKECYLGGMAKGSGMINPNMATTLNFITSDVDITAPMVQKALSEVVKVTYNCLCVDGDMSTNDTVFVMANGAAENNKITSEGEAFEIFKKALYIVMLHMTKMLAADGEGATKFLECTVSGAADEDTALIVAKSVISSDLVKCAMYGEDANFGRIMCAIGYSDAEVDVDKIDLDYRSEAGTIAMARNGRSLEFSEEIAAKILAAKDIYIDINLNSGDAKGRAWGCDLTYDYVKINGDYRS